MNNPVFTSRIDYIRQLFVTETPLMQQVRAAAMAENEDNISLHPEEGQLIALLCRMIDAKKIVEVGTFYGYSALWLASTGAQVWTLERDAARATRAREFIGHEHNIHLIEGDARKSLTDLAAQAPFDVVFIDADKLNYTHYLDWAERHVRSGGLIIGDNTFLFDAVWMDGDIERVRETARLAMRDFNRRLSDNTRYDSIMLSTDQGLTIARKK